MYELYELCEVGCSALSCHLSYGATLPDRMQKLHWMARAVVHIQQFLNGRNELYGPVRTVVTFSQTFSMSVGQCDHGQPLWRPRLLYVHP